MNRKRKKKEIARKKECDIERKRVSVNKVEEKRDEESQ